MYKNNMIIEQIRKFNREYTNIIGLMDRYLLDSKYTFQEVRVLFEIQNQKNCRYSDLKEKLSIDGGYLSRMIKKLEKEALINRKTSQEDMRAMDMFLTEDGEKLIRELAKLSNNQVYEMIQHLDQTNQEDIVKSMEHISNLLSHNKVLEEKEVISIREQLKTGDLGYLTYLHGKIYRDECGYDLDFEGYVAKTFYDFINRHNQSLDHFFIAEAYGEIIGCIGVLAHSEKEAQLRWFLVVPQYRNKGLGKELFKKAMNYCKEKNFNRVWLITTQDQEKAINMYKENGFTLFSQEPMVLGGKNLIEEKYEWKNGEQEDNKKSIDDFLL